MRKIVVILFSFLVLSATMKADEGMWLYTVLDKLNIEAKGCRLSADQIYSINHSSLKDAIVGLGLSDDPTYFFCSAELVSSKGLVFTNHHCGLEVIQKHSSLSDNFVSEGFWAKTLQDELPNKDITASILEEIVDLTDSIKPRLDTINDLKRRYYVQDSLMGRYEKREKRPGYSAAVSSFFDQNAFYLFIYKTYKDVRLVGAPPESIGKFGGDTDNWIWPRHTGDFSVLRIYTDSMNAPSEYSPKNKPLDTDKNLKISLKGYQKGDFAMIMGFPGATDRYMTSWAIDNKMLSNMNRIVVRNMKLQTMKEHMDADKAIEIKYVAKYYRSSNYWKYFIGENQALKALGVLDTKKKEEDAFIKWVNADTTRQKTFKETFTYIKAYFDTKNEILKPFDYINEGLFRGAEILDFAYDLNKILLKRSEAAKDSKEYQQSTEKINAYTREYFADYDIATDKDLLEKMLALYVKDVPEKFYPDFIKNIVIKRYKGNVHKFVEHLLKVSQLTSEEKTLKLTSKTLDDFQKDEAYTAMFSALTTIRGFYARLREVETNFDEGKRLYAMGLQQMYPDSLFYPDANSTPRLTYGTVGDYKARDAVFYKHFTTLKGVIEKEDPSNPDFVVPEKLKQLYRSKDYGRYAQNDTMYVCFTTDNDITGGNSGSAVLNADGELIGIAFDGNWEALSGDTVFEKRMQKTINVDIRYVLFIIEKFAGATNLINELTFAQ